MRIFASLRRYASSDANLKKTALYDVHVAAGAQMVPYAGYNMPLQYETGVKQEHLHCRSSCSVFDVSHMGQVSILGSERMDYMRKLIPANLEGLQWNQGCLSVILNTEGGILDDTVVVKTKDAIEMVINGACKITDLIHMKKVLEQYGFDKTVKIDHKQDKSLLALQGPKSMEVLSELLQKDLTKLPFMFKSDESSFYVGGEKVPVDIVRCGYTGEDGFEISMKNADAEKIWKSIIDTDVVKPCGLAARDSLRLEAGLCLYGNDMNENISIVEAQLLWLLPKKQREVISKFLETKSSPDMVDPRFIGCEKTLDFVTTKPDLKRAGFIVKGAPARQGAKIFDEAGEVEVGHVTSGVFSPSLGKPIAMGYIKRSMKIGAKVSMQVRNKKYPAELVKMPFVPSNYYRV